MRLLLDVGHSDRSARPGAAGGRTIAVVPETGGRSDPGVLLACAESAGPDGDQTATAAAVALGEAYRAAVDAESPDHALDEGFAAANAAARAGGSGRVAVLAGLVLRARRWSSGHAGNVRIWRYRDLQLKQLTRDHVAPRALGGVDVTRACGLAERLEPEYGEGEIREGDVFLLTSPGMHEVLAGAAILGVLQSGAPAQEMAEALIQRAAAARATGHLGACVVRAEKLPPVTTTAREDVLPVVAAPAPETEIDGFVIKKLVYEHADYRLYRAEDRESGAMVLLRFPEPGNEEAAQALRREERLGRRVANPYLLETIRVRTGRRTALYGVLEHRPIENLSQRIRRKRALAANEALQLAGHLLAALEALHAQGLVHGEIRARNLFCERRARRLWMLGFAQSERPARKHAASGSDASYCGPELFAGETASERSDIYAAAVTIYHMLSGRYPYGSIRSGEDWKAARAYRPLNRLRDGLPRALDEALERACAVDPARRYATVGQFVAALDGARAAHAQIASPQEARHGGERWAKWAAAGLAAGLLVYLYLTLT